jgi:hypothetical protein
MCRQPSRARAQQDAGADALAAAGAHQKHLVNSSCQLAAGYRLPAMPAGNAEAENRGNSAAKHFRPPDGYSLGPHAMLGRGRGGRESTTRFLVYWLGCQGQAHVMAVTRQGLGRDRAVTLITPGCGHNHSQT